MGGGLPPACGRSLARASRLRRARRPNLRPLGYENSSEVASSRKETTNRDSIGRSSPRFSPRVAARSPDFRPTSRRLARARNRTGRDPAHPTRAERREELVGTERVIQVHLARLSNSCLSYHGSSEGHGRNPTPDLRTCRSLGSRGGQNSCLIRFEGISRSPMRLTHLRTRGLRRLGGSISLAEPHWSRVPHDGRSADPLWGLAEPRRHGYNQRPSDLVSTSG